MHTIAIVSQKGGAGKTTLAVNLASAASAEFVTLIVDTDPQATASRWSQWRSGADPEVVDSGAPSLLAGKLAKSAELGAQLSIGAEL
ncbi:ParA family protein [Chenggangzhangella methanolivorans]|uniref:ParA family protein n=1 Tax=Chenggangzhangella methanolivorans TaxID=1437009 RepID=UPI00360697E7